jgi:hypothetical protein
MPLVDCKFFRDVPVMKFFRGVPAIGGVCLEFVEDGVYRRKGAWKTAGGRPWNPRPEDYNKATRMWQARGADREADRTAAGLDKGEFASLWDGEAYVLKII